VIKLDKSFLGMALRKVGNYRPVPELSDAWNAEGLPVETMKQVAEHRGESYDWAAVETKMNIGFHHFATAVPGSDNYTEPIPLHFVQHRSDDDNAIPLLLPHGWPSTLLE
jgi:hypothetical protein